MSEHPRTLTDDTMSRAPSPPAAASGRDPWIAPRSGWGNLAAMDRRGWMAVGGIAAGAAVIGGALGAGLHRTALFSTLLMSAMVVSVARMGWGWVRGRSRRARLREGVLSRVEEYGGGVYGTGAAITLLVLSAASLREEWARASGLADFLRGMTLEFWIGFSGESIRNAVWAGLWPLHWHAAHGMGAVLAVAAAAWAGDALADAWRRREPAAEPAETPAEAGAIG
jgi:hypothetical protein